MYTYNFLRLKNKSETQMQNSDLYLEFSCLPNFERNLDLQLWFSDNLYQENNELLKLIKFIKFRKLPEIVP